MKDTYTLDEAENELFGERSTPKREQYEQEKIKELADAFMDAYFPPITYVSCPECDAKNCPNNPTCIKCDCKLQRCTEQ